MKSINHKTITVGAVIAIGLLVLSGGVYADPVLDCQLAKLKAAGDRAKCLAKQESEKLKGNAFDFVTCETQFDAAIAAANVIAGSVTACRYIDNGNGTVSDLNTLLIWEKKVSGSSSVIDSAGVGDCLHCVDDTYAWTTAMSDWVSAVNGRTQSNHPFPSGLAGFEDWRVPNIQELEGIVDCGFLDATGACINPIFGPTDASTVFSGCLGPYWTSASTLTPPNGAWIEGFGNGCVGVAAKDDPDNSLPVRAVRGGR